MIDRQSVFAKIVAVMATMAASLLLLVGGFFWLVGGPSGGAFDRVLEDQARQIAATAPDLSSATRLGARLGLHMRYEGPAGVWSTDPSLPAIVDAGHRRPHGRAFFFAGGEYYVMPAPDGGAYLFAWNVSQVMQRAHVRLLVLLMLVMVMVVLAAHWALRRQLRPLRALSNGVARLGAGDLEVALPDQSRDEFGHLTRAFNQMVGRVREMIAARDQLLLDVSHELRSPLTRMKVALELMPETTQRAGMAADVAEMEGMIGELLELERLRGGGGRGLNPARQDLVPILRDVAGSFRNRAPGVRVGVTSPAIVLDVDAEKLRIVVRNLLENAVKYSPPMSRPVELAAACDGRSAVVRVTDYGPGIPEGDREHIFEPFFRVDRSRTKSTGGFGLGLSISKRIVEAHGGTIGIENNSGEGATFTVSLPMPG